MNKKVFFKWLELDVFPSLYEPQEDSFLLAKILSVPQGSRVLDLGCGCGMQGLTAAMRGASEIVFADLNPKALQNAWHNAELNAKALGQEKKFFFVESDLFSNLKNQLFDCIVFNPPYVPSDSKKKWVETDGGHKGREVLDRFLAEFSNFLKPNGTVFFLQSSLNGISETESQLHKTNFQFEIIGKEKLFFEELLVFKANRI